MCVCVCASLCVRLCVCVYVCVCVRVGILATLSYSGVLQPIRFRAKKLGYLKPCVCVCVLDRSVAILSSPAPVQEWDGCPVHESILCSRSLNMSKISSNIDPRAHVGFSQREVEDP